MIPVPRSDEPDDFDERVRQRGQAWIDGGGKGRPPSYWREALPDLRDAFEARCGYTAMHDLCGTVDHFVAVQRDRSGLYEWDNLRYASGWLNSAKKEAANILDPYEVGEGWFEVLWPSLQLVATDRIPPDMRALVDDTLRKLPIVDDERVVRQRRAWIDAYQRGDVTLEGLRRFAPLVAAAVEKHEGGATETQSARRPKSKRGTKRPKTKRKPTKPKVKAPSRSRGR